MFGGPGRVAHNTRTFILSCVWYLSLDMASPPCLLHSFIHLNENNERQPVADFFFSSSAVRDAASRYLVDFQGLRGRCRLSGFHVFREQEGHAERAYATRPHQVRSSACRQYLYSATPLFCLWGGHFVRLDGRLEDPHVRPQRVE